MEHTHEWYRDDETDAYVHVVMMTVHASVKDCYAYWWDFEKFPRFMTHVRKVTRIAPNAWHWEASVAGQDVEWDAIAETVPDESVSWHSTTGLQNSGIVRFSPESDGCHVTVHLSYDPPYGIIGDLLAQRRVNDEFHTQLVDDVLHFKQAVESGDAEKWHRAA